MPKSLSRFLSGWYLVYTRPKQEKRVAASLENKGISSFLPTSKVIRVWRDRKKIVDSPLFPSYVFVFLTSLFEYYTGLEAEGVVQYVRFGSEIATVKDTIINDIRLLSDKCDRIEVTPEFFITGQQTIISHGPLAGLQCEVVEMLGRQRVLVRVNLLKRHVLVDLPPLYLANAPLESGMTAENNLLFR